VDPAFADPPNATAVVKIGVREAARILNVSETTIYRWVDAEEIPFAMIQHHPMFHRVELLEWAMEREFAVSADLYEDERDHYPLVTALERGGGHMLGEDLGAIADAIPVATPGDRDVIRAVLAAREDDLFVTRPTDWIAMPKARSPIVCPDVPPLVALWWCGHRAVVVNDAPMNVLFAIVSPTIKLHLKLLSRLSLALHDRAFRTAVQQRGTFEPVVAEARRFEHELELAHAQERGLS
jgi:PTS system nitrogen regulatory IIA component